MLRRTLTLWPSERRQKRRESMKGPEVNRQREVMQIDKLWKGGERRMAVLEERVARSWHKSGNRFNSETRCPRPVWSLSQSLCRFFSPFIYGALEHKEGQAFSWSSTFSRLNNLLPEQHIKRCQKQHGWTLIPWDETNSTIKTMEKTCPFWDYGYEC